MTNGKFELGGIIELSSSALIGSGQAENTDMDILADANGCPFIPATSFIGILRHFLAEHFENEELLRVWGISDNTNLLESNIKCSDLSLMKDSRFSVKQRDGIKIDTKTGLTVDKSKYDYETIERGAKFSLRIEAGYSKTNKKNILDILATVAFVLSNGKISVGAKTNSGLGKIMLKDYSVYDYDFSNPEMVLNWLRRDDGKKVELPVVSLKNDQSFEMVIDIKLKNSLIVKSYPSDPQSSDAVNIKSGDSYLLPGTSIKGALRSRAEKILNTLFDGQNDVTDQIMDALFGNVKPEVRKFKAVKGRFKVEEEILPDFVAELQNRIRIDRFTGGTIASALFDSTPLFNNEPDINNKILKINIKVEKCKDYEAGLCLLLMKDLWTGDLALGGEKNIGRGVFQGNAASVHFHGINVSINSGLNPESLPEREWLQSLVGSLSGFKGVNI
ncbi:MAG: RAMP superfamily CRISPR-associated protein [Ignavibacteria bacterium]